MDCLFCKIISGEIPSHKVYEDENVIAILDINPTSKGHTLVIPKNHSRNIFDIDESDLKNLISAVKKVAGGIKSALSSDGVNININNEKLAGQLIYHTHIHIIPRTIDNAFKGDRHVRYKNGEIEEFRDKIKAVFEK